MASRIVDLLLPSGHDELFDRHRAAAIVSRVRGFAQVFALLTPAWIAVDALVFDLAAWAPLALLRLLTTAALAALALACRRPHRSIGEARVRLAAMFAIPLLFFAGAQAALKGVALDGAAEGLGAAYAFMPYLMACAVSAFPLTLVEVALFALPAFVAELWFLGFHGEVFPSTMAVESLWLMVLLAAVATFAALSQVRMLAALVGQAIRDPLTGCLRRDSGSELLEIELALATRRETRFALLFADLDRFKAVNDAFGHEVGDVVLARAAQALREAIRDSDTVIRWGGEEFVVLLPDAGSADAVRCIERLRSRGIAKLPDGRAVTLSIGIAERVEDGSVDSRELVELADRRMYAAKEAGRNRYVARDRAVTIVPELAAAA